MNYEQTHVSMLYNYYFKGPVCLTKQTEAFNEKEAS